MTKRDFVPKNKRKGVHCKDVRKFKGVHIPKATKQYPVTLPKEYVDALKDMYPKLSASAAIRRFVILSVRLTQRAPDAGDSDR